MHWIYIVNGYIAGFSVATTLGVSGAVILQNMMTGRIGIAAASVLAASCSDALCGSVVVFGMQMMQSVLLKYHFFLKLFAALFLCLFGIKNIVGSIKVVAQRTQNLTLLSAFGTVLFLGVIDPVSIADFMALTLGLMLDFSVMSHAFSFICGLWLGSLTWWSLLLCGVMFLQKGLPVYMLSAVQRVIGLMVLGFGVWLFHDAWVLR